MGTIQREAREALENANKHGVSYSSEFLNFLQIFFFFQGHEPGDELNETTTNVNKTPGK